MKKESYLFVCTGNTCRSPMAEYLAKGMAEEQGIEIETSSRGMNPHSLGGMLGVSKEACDAVLELYPKSKIYTHWPAILKPLDIENYGLILTMQEAHAREIIDGLSKYIKGLGRKVFTIKEYAGVWPKELTDDIDISDPMTGKIGFKEKGDPYLTCRDEIVDCLDLILSGKNKSIEEILKFQTQRDQAFLEQDQRINYNRKYKHSKFSGKSPKHHKQKWNSESDNAQPIIETGQSDTGLLDNIHMGILGAKQEEKNSYYINPSNPLRKEFMRVMVGEPCSKKYEYLEIRISQIISRADKLGIELI